MIQVAFKSCIFAMLNVRGLRSDFWDVSCWSRVEAGSVVYKTCSGAGQTQLTLGFCLSSAGSWSICSWCLVSATVYLMSQRHSAMRFKELLLLEQLLAPRTCPDSRAGDFGWCRFVVPQTEWLSLSITRLLLQTCAGCGQNIHSCVPHLCCPSKSSILQVMSWPETVLGNGSGRKFPLNYPARGMGSPVGGDVVAAASIPGQLHLSKKRWMGLVNTELSVIIGSGNSKMCKIISEYKKMGQ